MSAVRISPFDEKTGEVTARVDCPKEPGQFDSRKPIVLRESEVFIGLALVLFPRSPLKSVHPGAAHSSNAAVSAPTTADVLRSLDVSVVDRRQLVSGFPEGQDRGVPPFVVIELHARTVPGARRRAVRRAC